MASGCGARSGTPDHCRLVNVKTGTLPDFGRIELNECGHPVPDERRAGRSVRIAAIASAARRRPRYLPDLGRRVGVTAAARAPVTL